MAEGTTEETHDVDAHGKLIRQVRRVRIENALGDPKAESGHRPHVQGPSKSPNRLLRYQEPHWDQLHQFLAKSDACNRSQGRYPEAQALRVAVDCRIDAVVCEADEFQNDKENIRATIAADQPARIFGSHAGAGLDRET